MMYYSHKTKLYLLWFMAFVSSYMFKLSYSVDIAGQVIMTLSILFGFYITSISVILVSRVLLNLHEQEDERGDRRLSHTLIDYYKFGLLSVLIGIVEFLVVSMFVADEEMSILKISKLTKSIDLDIKLIINSLASAQLATCILFSFIHVKLLLVLFTNEAYIRARKNRSYYRRE